MNAKTIILSIGDELIAYPGITESGEHVLNKKYYNFIINRISDGKVYSKSNWLYDISLDNPKWYVNGELYDISTGDKIIIPTYNCQKVIFEPTSEINKNTSVNVHIEKAKELLDNIAKCEELTALALKEFSDYVKNNF